MNAPYSPTIDVVEPDAPFGEAAPAAQAHGSPLAAIATLVAPSSAEIMRPAETGAKTAELITITNAEDRQFAIEEIQALKEAEDRLEAKRTAITGPMNAALKAINALFKPASEALIAAQSVIKRKVVAFDTEQARIAAASRAKAEAEAREAQRKAAAEAAAKAAEAEAAARVLQEQAQAAADAGNLESAAILDLEAATVQQEATQAVAQAHVATYAPTVAYTAPAKTGTATREVWKAELTNLHELVKHVAAHPEHINLLSFDQSAGNTLAKALKNGLNVPGLRATMETSLAVRRKAA